MKARMVGFILLLSFNVQEKMKVFRKERALRRLPVSWLQSQPAPEARRTGQFFKEDTNEQR